MLLGRGHSFAHLRRRDRFIMIDPFMNAVYADGWDSLSTMHNALGEHDLARSANENLQRTTEALNDLCWDETDGRWIYLRGTSRAPELTLAIGSIFPLIIGAQDHSKVNDAVQRHLLNETEFWTPYPVPSVAASEPTFDPDGESTIWRGTGLPESELAVGSRACANMATTKLHLKSRASRLRWLLETSVSSIRRCLVEGCAAPISDGPRLRSTC